MQGRSNILGSEEVLFSHYIILYITGELYESMKYECICLAEDNQVAKSGFISPPAPSCVCQNSLDMHPNVLN